jgi:capsid protein
MPDEKVIGVPEDSLADWSETQETRFALWARNKRLCDYKGQKTFGQLQANIRMEAMLGGDSLVVLRQDPATSLPQVQIVPGNSIQTPSEETSLRAGHTIKHGVELDAVGRHVAFWVNEVQTDDSIVSKRIPAFGPRSGRRIAWLVYGTEKRTDEVRGTPLLGLILQSLKEIDRYRDSAQRKAVVNSIIAAFIKKTQDKMGTLPVTGGAVRVDTATTTDTTADGTPRTFNIASQIPGVFIEELQHGEEPTPYSISGTDVNFGPFEAAIIHAIAWANEIPPEILTISFSHNYSASQAADSEWKIYLNKARTSFGTDVNQPVYEEWFISEALLGKSNAVGFLDAWRDPQQYDVYEAWVTCEWSGAIKPSIDINKQAEGHKKLVAEGWSTNARTTRELTGMKWSKNIKIIKRENELKAEAVKPLLESKQQFGEQPVEEALADLAMQVGDMVDAVEARSK